jgi:MerR family copper efflux transcriptional regulator
LEDGLDIPVTGRTTLWVERLKERHRLKECHVDSLLKIGELAARTGVTAKTIRFYETAGVVPPPVRSANGYRRYRSDAVDLLRFVKQARGLDLTLAEIKALVAIRRRGQAPCAHVYDLLNEKARELVRKLKDVTALRRQLRRSARRPGPQGLRGSAVCPHIETRMSDGPSGRRSTPRGGARPRRGENLDRSAARLEG